MSDPTPEHPAPRTSPASSQAPSQASSPAPARARSRGARPRKAQYLTPRTAATKLGVHLPATPEEFRAAPISRDDLAALEADPPAWLTDLRRRGPHPRQVVAARLRVSRSALARAGLTEALTTEQIDAILADPPEWLGRERASLAEVRREEARLAEARRAAADEA